MNLHNVQEAVSVQDANIGESSFTKTRLAGARFDDVNLKGATFTNVNLSGVTFVDVNLSGASISEANLAGARINGVLVDDMVRAYRGRDDDARRAAPVATTGPASAVLYVKDLPRLQRFYLDVLGFSLEQAGGSHAVLASPTFRLVLVEISANIASSIAIEDPPRVRSESPIKLVFATPSIAAVRSSAGMQGGNILPEAREWEFEGTRVCDGNDPEGNVFQLRQAR